MAWIEYPHFFSTWEGYARVQFFQSRFVDLHSRFKNIMKALPERFHVHNLMNKLNKLQNSLTSFLQVTVIGQEDLPPGSLVQSAKALDKHTMLPPVSQVHRMHICILHMRLNTFDEETTQAVEDSFKHILRITESYPELTCIFIICETRTQTDTEMFRSKLQQMVGQMVQTHLVADILVGPTYDTLPTLISDALEKEIIEGFSDVFTFLQRFVRKEVRFEQEDENVLEHDTVVNEIAGFFRNGLTLVDEKRLKKDIPLMELILQTLCSKIHFASVSALAVKHSLPDWLCHNLLEELKFDKELRESISQNTLHHLKGFEEYVRKLEERLNTPDSVGKPPSASNRSFDFIVYMLQKDLTPALAPVETKLSFMNRVTLIMKKMMFEIRGYLMQSSVPADIQEIGQRELTSEDISPELEEGIMCTNGVFGMGILYGQLEVHLKLNLTDEEVKDAKRTLANITRKFRFHHPYTVKSVEYYPSVLARHFYEQGDTLVSKFPDDEFQCREGSLGCFVRGSDGFLYAITCAHVVDPHEKEEHDVYTTKRSKRKLGVSSRRMMMYGTELEEGMHLVDFAAIRVLRDEEDSCSCTLKDESGNDKRARVETEFSKDLIGTFVYKYGAETELTKGMIAANKYSFTGQTSSEHLLIIDSLPDICDNLNGMFSSKDSYSIANSQMSNATNVQTAMDDVDFVDLLQLETNNCALPSGNSFDTQDHPSLEESTHYGESTDPQKCRASSKIQNIQPRPESMDVCDDRDREMFLSRNTHEIQNSPLSDNLCTMLPTGPFAQKGDSGSIVCRRDLKNDVIVAISMIVAGDFTFKESVPVKTESDNTKCVSVRLDRTLTKLTERCGVEFTIN